MSKMSQILSFSFKTWDPGTRLCYIIISGKNMWSISIFLIFPIKNEKKVTCGYLRKEPELYLFCTHPPLISFLTHSQCGYRSRIMWSFRLIGAQQYLRENRCLEALSSGKGRKLLTCLDSEQNRWWSSITCHRETWKWVWTWCPQSLLICWPFVNCLECRSNSIWMGKEVLQWVRFWFCHLTD